MRKHLILGLAVVACAALAGACHPIRLFGPGLYHLDSTSPDGKYRILIDERPKPPGQWDSIVHFTVWRDGAEIVHDCWLWGDESSCAALFPDAIWESPNVLRLTPNDTESRDTVVVANRSTRPLAFAQVETREIVLCFDLEPGTERTVRVCSQTEKRGVWMTAHGRFRDGVDVYEQKFDSSGLWSKAHVLEWSYDFFDDYIGGAVRPASGN